MLPIVASLLEAGLGILGGAVASKGKELIESKFGLNLDSMISTQEGKIELLKVQSDHEEALLKLSIESKQQEIELVKIDQQNTDGARNMQVAALAQTDTIAKRFIYYFAGFWSLLSIAYIFLITFATIPVANVRFADTILGFILGTIIGTIINFFFGSSRQSQAKDTALAEALKGIK
jgi:hypothetical protein